MSDKIRALFVGHAASPTGYARVLHSLLAELPAERYELHHLGINLSTAAPPAAWTIHPNPEPADRHGVSAASRLVERLRPDLLFVLGEVSSAARHAQLFATCLGRTRTVVYAAVDGRYPVLRRDVDALSNTDRIVTFTRFGRDSILETRSPGAPALEIDVIPHGVDTTVFHPIGRTDARRELFPDEPGMKDAFIVLNANRNQPFKRIDITLEGFARFAHGKPPGVRLYLHMGTAAPAPGTVPLADRLGIRERLLVTTRGDRHPDVSNERLNAIYNACDVGVNTSVGEGWGLVSFEHAATRAAQVVPRHTACAELWPDAALFLDPLTVATLAARLEYLYADRDACDRLAGAARRLATRPDLQWAHIGAQWDRYFAALLSS